MKRVSRQKVMAVLKKAGATEFSAREWLEQKGIVVVTGEAKLYNNYRTILESAGIKVEIDMFELLCVGIKE